MAQRDHVGRALRRLDAGHPSHGEHIALRHLAVGDEDGRVGMHEDLAAGDGPTVCRVLRRDVDHSCPAERIEVRELAGHDRESKSAAAARPGADESDDLVGTVARAPMGRVEPEIGLDRHGRPLRERRHRPDVPVAAGPLALEPDSEIA